MNYQVAVLSRGYKRSRQKGFFWLMQQQLPVSIGDEPFQLHTKFPRVQVAVDAQSQKRHPTTLVQGQAKRPDVILLDDAFQHRKVQAGLINILLTAYDDLFSKDFIFCLSGI